MKWSKLKTLEAPQNGITPESIPTLAITAPPAAPNPTPTAATPEQVAAARVIGEQAQVASTSDKRLDEFDKRLANLATENEALRVRVLNLERAGTKQEPVSPATPTAVSTSTQASSQVTTPEKAAGNPVTGMPAEAGEHAGKFLRRKKDENDADFQARFSLTGPMLDWWKANQATEDAKLQ